MIASKILIFPSHSAQQQDFAIEGIRQSSASKHPDPVETQILEP
jgi:hypothetical protein